MRTFTTLVVIILILGAGCSSAHATGVLSGDLVYQGLPGPPGTPVLLRSGSVEVRSNAQAVTTTRFADGHGFTFTLRTGKYQVIGRSGDAGCPPSTVSIVRGKTTTLHIVCSVR